MEKNKNHYAIIMAGGVGTRFWPSSRSTYPKQFLDILGTGNSLLQLTYKRFLKHFLPENIYIVTNVAYLDLVKTQIPTIDMSQVLGEPTAKNTAACIAFASSKIHHINTHAISVVAPSDHLILDEDKFMEYLNGAMVYAQKNEALITLGIRPNRPDTGYGYIQYIDEGQNNNIFKVKTFTEKPTLEIAQTFLESGDFLWNAGIFVWSGSSIRNAFKEHLPEQYALFHEASKYYGAPDEAFQVQKIYEQCRSISIDYGIMEKASNVYVIPSDFGWSDLGTWTSLYEISDKDARGNVVKGKNVFAYDTKDCMISANGQNGRLVVVKSAENLIIVDTPDVLMICDKNHEQEVKQIVNDIKMKFDEKYI
ncbi:MAG: mannose-1-phosphate guanylyltransferase [Bacteroidota bacterium]